MQARALFWLMAIGCGLAVAAPSAHALSYGAPTFYTHTFRGLSVATADFSGDGNGDFAVADNGNGNLAVRFGNGAGGFGAPSIYALGPGIATRALTVARINGDTAPDLVAASSVRTQVLLNNGSGGFGSPITALAGSASDVAAADVTGDGFTDLVVAQDGGGARIVLGDGAGGFTVGSALPVDGTATSVAIGQLNADTIPDLAVGTTSSKVSILLGAGGGLFNPQVSFPANGVPASVVVANFDSDSDSDLAVDDGPSQVSVLLGNGNGTFGAATSYAVDNAFNSDLAASDLNGDGHADLAVTSESFNSVSILLADGSGGFAPRVSFPAGSGPIGLAVGPLNGDSTPDLITAPQQTAAVLLSVVPQLSTSTVIHPEGNTGTTAYAFTVTASSRSVDTVTADVQTVDDSATVANGDYVPLGPQTVTIAPGQSSAGFTVQGNGDFSFEPDERFFVHLNNPVNASVAGDGTGWLLNDDEIGYPRPRAATPVSVPLVPAFERCNAPDRVHAAPLNFPSCSIPTQRSQRLTVGTPDANGQAANSIGLVQYAITVGNPGTAADEADVRLMASITDVRDKLRMSDYIAELWATATLRITDRNQAQPQTTVDLPLGFAVPCTATSDTTTGSTCSVATTIDSVVPGAVPEGARSVWQAGPVQVQDGGEDGEGATTSDNTLFLTQGIFVP